MKKKVVPIKSRPVAYKCKNKAALRKLFEKFKAKRFRNFEYILTGA